MRNVSFRNPNSWIMLIFIAGISYLLSLQLLLADGVFFSGDSGLKALITQNLADGYQAFDLNLPDPPWVVDLWKVGLYPYDRPFVYPIEDKYYSQYPIPFPLVTAPFYALWGYYGLYVVPWAATIVTWLIFYWVLKKIDVSLAAIVIGLFFLIFASHLSLYSATYWEHTLSVCLAFGGIGLIFPKNGSAKLNIWAALWAGILTGLAVWFRPEQIFVVLFLGVISLFSFMKAVWRLDVLQRINIGRMPDYIGKTGLVFIAASLITLLLYGFINWLIYKNVFGVHAIQVLEHQPLRERVFTFIDNLQAMTVGRYSFFLATPISLFTFGLPLITLLWRRSIKHQPDWILWVVFSLAFILGVAVLVPESAGGKQWGPRFLLMLVPVIVLLFTRQMDFLLKSPIASKTWFRLIIMGIVIILAVVGIYQNPIRGREFLISNTAPIKEMVEDLRSVKTGAIGVSNAYLTQLYQPAVSREVNFLLIPEEYELALFTRVLNEQNQDSFRFLCYSYACEFFDPAVASKRVAIDEDAFILHIRKIRDYERFRILDIRIEESE